MNFNNRFVQSLAPPTAPPQFPTQQQFAPLQFPTQQQQVPPQFPTAPQFPMQQQQVPPQFPTAPQFPQAPQSSIVQQIMSLLTQSGYPQQTIQQVVGILEPTQAQMPHLSSHSKGKTVCVLDESGNVQEYSNYNFPHTMHVTYTASNGGKIRVSRLAPLTPLQKQWLANNGIYLRN